MTEEEKQDYLTKIKQLVLNGDFELASQLYVGNITQDMNDFFWFLENISQDIYNKYDIIQAKGVSKEVFEEYWGLYTLRESLKEYITLIRDNYFPKTSL